MRALGFCVSVAHARFMARHFNNHGIPSSSDLGDSPRAEREQALRDLSDGTTRVVFSVDLFNEGIDVPSRWTPSSMPRSYLKASAGSCRPAGAAEEGQEQGRLHGSRLCRDAPANQDVLRFDRRYRALLGGSRQDLAAPG